MSMDFWEAQRKARLRTTIALILFLLMTIAIAFLAEMVFQMFIGAEVEENFPLAGTLFIIVTLTTALFQYLMYKNQGGGYVAESLGATLATQGSSNLKKAQLYHIVQEMAISAAIPMPAVYILKAPAINAFAAGLTQDKAAITVTEGALNTLSRDELQGVIAHEIGHIKNGDMRIGLQLAAMISGFFVLLYISFRVLDFSRFQRSDESNKGNATAMIAFVLILAGSLAWLGGSILRSLVSRQREYLADASSVQFTRNPDGLIGALEKIKRESTHEMPKYGKPFEHLYFDKPSSFFNLFDTHPPIDKRIAALKGLPNSSVD